MEPGGINAQENSSKIVALQEELDALKTTSEEFVQNMRDVVQSNKNLQNKTKELNKDVQNKIREISDLEETVKKTDIKFETLNSSYKSLAIAYDKQKKEINDLVDSRERAENSNKQLNQICAKVNDDMSLIKNEMIENA